MILYPYSYQYDAIPNYKCVVSHYYQCIYHSFVHLLNLLQQNIADAAIIFWVSTLDNT